MVQGVWMRMLVSVEVWACARVSVRVCACGCLKVANGTRTIASH